MTVKSPRTRLGEIFTVPPAPDFQCASISPAQSKPSAAPAPVPAAAIKLSTYSARKSISSVCWSHLPPTIISVVSVVSLRPSSSNTVKVILYEPCASKVSEYLEPAPSKVLIGVTIRHSCFAIPAPGLVPNSGSYEKLYSSTVSCST